MAWSLHLIPKNLLTFCVISGKKSKSIITLDAAREAKVRDYFFY